MDIGQIMKKISDINSLFNQRMASVGAPLVRSTSILTALLLAGAGLLGLGEGSPAAAAVFPPVPTFDGPVESSGVFRIVVDPAFYSLVGGTAAPPLAAYPGYNDPAFPPVPALVSPPNTLTSPWLYDQSTVISLSGVYNRPLIGATQVGAPPYPPAATLRGYTDYSCPGPIGEIPFLFIVDPPPAGPGFVKREILTEVYDFDLTSSGCPLLDPRIPLVSNLTTVAVQAGVGQGLPMPSLGMVQAIAPEPGGGPFNDFPARSFFNIYAQVTLPPVPSTVSFGAFPATGAVLYNDCTHPLFIQALSILSLPPTVVYLHDNITPAVPVKFLSDNLPYWHKDDVFGYMVLAGHGLLYGCGQVAGPGPKSSTMLDAVLGPIGTSAKQAPIPFLYPSALFPTPSATYNSAGNIDVLSFTDPGVGTVYARNFIHGNLLNSIALPAPNGSVDYTDAVSTVSFEISLDDTNWFAETGSGQFQVLISNTNGPSGVYSNYDLQMQQLTLGCSGLFTLQLRASTSLPSVGKHFVAPSPQGYNIASEIDMNYELSTDGVNYYPGDRSLRVQVVTANCGSSAPISVQRSGSSVILSWSDSSYRLQGSTNLSPTAWVNVAGKSPITNSAAGPFHYYRLICP